MGEVRELTTTEQLNALPDWRQKNIGKMFFDGCKSWLDGKSDEEREEIRREGKKLLKEMKARKKAREAAGIPEPSLPGYIVGYLD